MKSNDTIKIEQLLHKQCFKTHPKLANEFGTTEVQLCDYKITKGIEYVDFLSYDANDIFRCYEIKVSLADFHSNAKKSWYGHYNYLVMSTDLYNQKDKTYWRKEIPKGIGLITFDLITGHRTSIFKATRNEIDDNIYNMLKNSLLKTLFYQNHKFRIYKEKLCDPNRQRNNY